MNKKVKQTGCHFLHLLCGPLDEETVFEKRGEGADGAVDKKNDRTVPLCNSLFNQYPICYQVF